MLIKKSAALILCTLLIGATCAALAILTTPLRYVQLREPTIKNIVAKTFSEQYEKSPEAFTFIDVRDSATYVEGHPKGAINIPLARLYTEREKLPKQGKKIVLICGGNSASGVAYSYLEHYGFRNIERVPGGYKEWLVEGLPIETGTTTTSQY